MFSKRYSIRTALVAMLIVAGAFYFVPPLLRRMKFADQYHFLKNNKWQRAPHKAEGYEFHAPNGALLSVFTTEHEYNEKTGVVEPTSYAPDPTRFFVVPPGKWVNTVDEVLETWDRCD